MSVLVPEAPRALADLDVYGQALVAKPAVVFIRHRDALNRGTTGTGFFVSPNGHILTCAHVVAPTVRKRSGKKPEVSDKIWVRVPDGSTQEATRLYCDTASDVAVVRIDGARFRYLSLSQFPPVQGQDVILLGYPLGQALGKEVTVTRGIVSALRLNSRVFQLDAAASPGNSGGPVLDESSKVIGIAFAKVRGQEGMNFAVSSAYLPDLTKVVPGAHMLYSQFFDAIEDDDVSRVQALIQQSPELVRGSSPYGNPPLVAADHKSPALVQLLIQRGADVNARNEYGFAALHFALLEVSRALLAAGADVDARDKYGETPLHLASGTGHVAGAELLLRAGADVNARNKSGEVPLHRAAFGGDVSTIRLLLSKGADVNACDQIGDSPLSCAATEGHVEALSLLLANGADCRGCEGIMTPLHSAALFGHVEAAALLISHGADVNARSSSLATPLHCAATGGHSRMIALLLSSGADTKAKDVAGKTPLALAVENGYTESAELLGRHATQ
jgi:ankyrin repeat protein